MLPIVNNCKAVIIGDCLGGWEVKCFYKDGPWFGGPEPRIGKMMWHVQDIDHGGYHFICAEKHLMRIDGFESESEQESKEKVNES